MRWMLTKAVAAALFLATATAFPADWETLRDCQYLDNPANDGDSFHVTHKGKEYIFRLYFVDCPETTLDTMLERRLAEQAAHFQSTPDDMLKWGRSAAALVREMLRDKPLTITTRWREAGGRSKLPRYFATVEVQGVDLAKRLVTDGLARVYGVGDDVPGQPAASIQWGRLRSLEQNARDNKRGAWHSSHPARDHDEATGTTGR